MSKQEVNGHRGAARRAAKESGRFSEWRPRSAVIHPKKRPENNRCRGRVKLEDLE